MASFKDAADRVWDMRIDWGAMRRSAAAGVDLSQVEDHLFDFYRGSIKLIDAVWAVCEPTARKRTVTRDEFELGVVGDVMESAREALIAGLADFFPSLRAKVLREVEKESAEMFQGLQKLLPSASTESPEQSE